MAQFPFPDLVLLDIDMPHLDGWQVLESLKSIKDILPELPIIIMLSSLVDSYSLLKASSFPDLSGIFKKPMSVDIYKNINAKYFLPASVK